MFLKFSLNNNARNPPPLARNELELVANEFAGSTLGPSSADKGRLDLMRRFEARGLGHSI